MVQVAATEFICFVTSDSIDSVLAEGRVAVREQDLMDSVERLGFGSYASIMETQL